jgi:hypothetical protein
MRRLGISRFVGSWVAASGHRLRIRRVSKDKASVDFLDSCGKPVRRPYRGGAPSLEMAAHYDAYDDEFEVDLWDPRKGFTLHLSHEETYELDKRQREALVPGISRYEEDCSLDEFYSLFGRLEHFVRETDAEGPAKFHGHAKIRRPANSPGGNRPW